MSRAAASRLHPLPEEEGGRQEGGPVHTRLQRLASRVAAVLAAACIAGLGAPAGAEIQVYQYFGDAFSMVSNTYIIDDGAEITIVDTQFDEAGNARLLDQVRRMSTSEVRRVIVTQSTPQKFGGIAYFNQQGIETWVARSINRILPTIHRYKKIYWQAYRPAAPFPTFDWPNRIFEGEVRFPLADGSTLVAQDLERPCAGNAHAVVRIEGRKRALFTGDLVVAGIHPWLEGPIVGDLPDPNLPQWSQCLRRLLPLAKDATVYPGQGYPAPATEQINEQIRYLDVVDRAMAEYLKKTPLGYDAPHSGDLQNAAKRIGETVAAKFPRYESAAELPLSLEPLLFKAWRVRFGTENKRQLVYGDYFGTH